MNKRHLHILTCVAMICMLAFMGKINVNAEGVAPPAPNCNIIYDFENGDYYAVDGVIAMSMMMTNPDGSYYIEPTTGYYVLDEAKTKQFINALSDLHKKNSNELDFQSTRGDIVKVSGGTMTRRYIDVDTEYPYLAQAIMESKQEVHIPRYDVGTTYVEIDITKQMLNYYENGTLRVTTPIVTGNERANHYTPQGIYFVRAKARNQTLIGLGLNGEAPYESFVNYWVPIIGNSIGIHDATWRSKFGGEIYLGNGSHGCINVPLAAMQDLYPILQKGTPVVVFK